MSRFLVKTSLVLVLTFLICQLVHNCVVRPFAETAFFCCTVYSQEANGNKDNDGETNGEINWSIDGESDEDTSLKGAEDIDNLGVPEEEITIAVELGPIVFLQQNSERGKAYTFNFNVRVFPENTGGTIKLEIYENPEGSEGGEQPIHSIYVDAAVPGSLYPVKETWLVPADVQQGKDKYKVTAVYQKDDIIVKSDSKIFSLWEIPKPLADPLPEEGIPSTPIKVQLKMPDGGPSDVKFYYTLDDTAPDAGSNKYPDKEIEVGSFLEPLTAVAEKDGVFSEAATYYYNFSYEDCFIATAAYGSPLEPSVMLLRQFRDRYLLTNSPGRLAVGLYYRFSPPAARIIHDHEILKNTVRWLLKPVVYLISFFP